MIKIQTFIKIIKSYTIGIPRYCLENVLQLKNINTVNLGDKSVHYSTFPKITLVVEAR